MKKIDHYVFFSQSVFIGTTKWCLICNQVFFLNASLLLTLFFLIFRIHSSALKDQTSTLLLACTPRDCLSQPQTSFLDLLYIELHSNSHLICKYKVQPQLLFSQGQSTIYLLFELLVVHFSLSWSDLNICFVKLSRPWIILLHLLLINVHGQLMRGLLDQIYVQLFTILTNLFAYCLVATKYIIIFFYCRQEVF